MEDYNQPSPERIDLLKHLQGKIGSVTPHFWAACQICDLSALENQVVRHWGVSPRVQKSQPSTPKTPTPQKSTASSSGLSPSPSALPPPSKRQKTLDSPKALPQDANTKKQAEERDNSRCVLTGIKEVEVAHIYPHHSMKYKEEDIRAPRHAFWEHLRAFWPEEKVTAWEVKLFPQGICEKGQEEVYNLISLAPTTHAIWDKGRFALKPISESDDKKTLIVQFFWQEKQNSPFSRMTLTTIPISTQGLDQTAGVWLFEMGKKSDPAIVSSFKPTIQYKNHYRISGYSSCNGSFSVSRAWQVLLTLIGRPGWTQA